MCCNIIYHVPVPRGREYPSLGHSQDLKQSSYICIQLLWLACLLAEGHDVAAAKHGVVHPHRLGEPLGVHALACAGRAVQEQVAEGGAALLGVRQA
eukprot:1181372-Prorocentrum_minimum.AAC.1